MMEKAKILIVDDEQDLREILLYNLTEANYQVECAASAEEALSLLPGDFQLILLDVMMPGKDGFQLANELKSSPLTASIPIIFLTARDSEEDTLRGFGIGADDYVTKPFSPREVLARVGAVLSRTANNRPLLKNEITCDDLRLDMARKIATLEGQSLQLTRTEFELLALLMTHPRHVFSRKELIETVWPSDVIVTNRTVDVNIARLRKKLGSYAVRLVARQGYGYLFE